MKMFSWLVAAIAVISLSAGSPVYAACLNNDIQCNKVGGVQKYRVTKDGNVEAAGTMTVTGAITASAGVISAAPDTLYSRTLAQMNALAPTAAGQTIYVSDAAQSRVCVSSGTGTGAWVVAVATGVFTAASYPHCN